MRRFITTAALLFCALTPSSAADLNQLDGNPTLFSVMAALNVAGFDTGVQSGANHPMGDALRKHFANRNLPVINEIRNFLLSHKKADPGAGLAQYVSFALSVTEPPAFQSRFQSSAEVPPDVAALEGFDKLMARFHREANMDELWKQSQPFHDQVIARYQEPVSRAILEATGYVRNVTSGYMGRHFQIYLDLLGPPNQVHTRSYKDDYYIVVTPSAEPQTEDIRHAYLHYLLDPLSTKYWGAIEKKKSLIDFAQGAPALDESYRSDFLLLVTESLIKAIESRLPNHSGLSRPAQVEQALTEGFILTPFFSEQLSLYEKQESAMRLYFPEMIAAIDLRRETRRLDAVKFASAKTTRKAQAAPETQEPVLTGAAKTLEDGDRLYADRDLDKARAAFLRSLEQTDDKAIQARAYYGLARISTLQNNGELADKLFRKTLELSPDPPTRAWCEFYLGRLADIAGEREEAAQHYRAALAVEGATGAARKAAEQGLKKNSENPK